MSDSQIIPIEQVENDRSPIAGDNLAPLKRSLKAVGQLVPIIVDDKMQLIDGERRLRALRQMGETTVNAVISSTLEETAEVLLEATNHGLSARPLTPRRAWEIFAATGDQQRERGHRMRHRRSGMTRNAVLEPMPRARELLAAALGLEGESFLATSALIYKAVATNKDPARAETLAGIVTRLEAGEITLYQARGAIERVQKGLQEPPPDAAVTVDAQRDALATALSQLRGTTHGIQRLGEISAQMQPVEIQMYLKGFEEGRRVLQRFIVNLRKRATEK